MAFVRLKPLLCFCCVCFAPLFPSQLSAARAAANAQPQALASSWKFINYPWSNTPHFLISPGEQWNHVSLGLRLDILSITQGFWFFKTNFIAVRLHRANGEAVEPTEQGKKRMNSPVSMSYAAVLPDGSYAPQVATYFPWGPNVLEEAWISVTIDQERYWVEIPYGFDRNPADPLSPASPGGPPKFAVAMQSLGKRDRVIQWQHVDYGLEPRLVLKQSNPGAAKSEVVLYNNRGTVTWQPWNLSSPRTVVRLLADDGTEVNGQCVNLHLGDNRRDRTDTFQIYDNSSRNTRSWGRIEVSVNDQTNQVIVPFDIPVAKQ